MEILNVAKIEYSKSYFNTQTDNLFAQNATRFVQITTFFLITKKNNNIMNANTFIYIVTKTIKDLQDFFIQSVLQCGFMKTSSYLYYYASIHFLLC